MQARLVSRVTKPATILAITMVAAGCGYDTSRILSPVGCTDKEVVDAELHIDATDDRWIWAVDRLTGKPISLRLGGSYGVNPDPPAIVDPAGTVIARPGDLVVSGCHDIVQDALLIDAADIRTR